MDKNIIYLKIIGDKVEACGDLETIEFFEDMHKTGRLYDKVVSSEEWNAAGCIARIVDGEVVLGLSDDDLYDENSKIIRFERDERLKECDLISPMRWESMNENQQRVWMGYRLALLNIPQQEGFPWGGDINKVPWPEKPDF